VSEASLHGSFCHCRWLRQQGRHDAVSSTCVNSKKIAHARLKIASVGREKHTNIAQRARMLCSLSIFVIAGATGLATPLRAQEEPITEQGYEREELGVNPYTAPSIARIFQQLDELKPLPFEQLHRELPRASPGSREQKALLFGGLVADGFLIVEAERKSAVDNLGRVLMREARGLGVADRVTRHNASLTDLARRGDWLAVRKELIATQADVEQAMVELRDQKMAHLISLGGWLRGLEISAGAIELNFSPQRAAILAKKDLVDYFAAELTTLPPTLAHTPLFQKLRSGVNAVHLSLSKATGEGLKLADVKAIHAQARELDLAIRQSD
jgi:hypothetical protein